jgi:NDP-sugar pyrophosphorylase family protein
MKIIIPMAGQGKRFLAAGYKTPKPLIQVEGKTILEHIVENFSPQHDEFIFAVNEEHLEKFNIKSLIERSVSHFKIISMPYQKEGPIGVLKNVLPTLKEDEPVIVNYCDFSWVWDYSDFKKKIKEHHPDGAVICYHGFHPHLLGPNLYATLDTDDDGMWMKEIREKHTWHENKQDDWTSSGTYYFKSSKHLENLCQQIESRPALKINEEFYVSQLYQLMREAGQSVFIYEIPYMLQWGTPQDLEEYFYWSDYFRQKDEINKTRQIHDMTALILMAGAGKRFSDVGYKMPKPFIPIESQPMVVASTKSMPLAKRNLFMTRKNVLQDADGIDKKVLENFENAEFITFDELTEGQACTALLARERIQADEPLLIEACDHGILYDEKAFIQDIAEDSGIDAIIFTFRDFPPVVRNPKAYGWVAVDEDGHATRVSVKVPLKGDPLTHHAIIGSFWFRKAEFFFKAADSMIEHNSRINNEFYIDEAMNFAIQLGYNVHVFEVDRYVSWGTPNDLKTYEYWQRYFHRVDFHPYQINESDSKHS